LPRCEEGRQECLPHPVRGPIMRRATAVAALAGLLALPALAADPTYPIRLKKEAEGDKVRVTSTDAGDVRFALEVMGQALKKGEKKTVRQAYTEEIDAKPAGAK